jgi:peptide/nickel transport system ATP-binding protein/oligopeptide transport system ATP-binding protein
MTELLEVRDLRVDFPLPGGVLHAVDGASFELRAGEALGIVGESGSGKTMALRALVGLLPRAARLAGGEIVFEGVDLASASAETLRAIRGRSIAMIFQEPMTALNPVMRVGEQIAEGPLVRLGYSRRRAHERALELMRLVGIPDPEERAEAYAHELSGGMRQRVMIAIALSMEPKLILCDEPTTALDVTIQDQILKLLKRLRDELGMSIVLVSHDLGVIAQMCERVAVMYAGQVVEHAPVRELIRNPRHPYTVGLLSSLPGLETSSRYLVPIPGAPPRMTQVMPGCRFASRCPLVLDDCLSWETQLLAAAPGHESRCLRHEIVGGRGD